MSQEIGLTQGHAALFLLGFTMFFASVLAFGLEPLVGRMLLPLFGGAAHVWLTALMVFQGLLLAAYSYGHLIAGRLGPLHIGVLLLGGLVLPLGLPSAVPAGSETGTLVALLFLRIGPPFFALSTTAVVLQLWHTRSWIGQEREPYPLYAASSVGSILALLAYPFVIEPLSGLQAQRTVWSLGYGLFVALVAVCWAVLRPRVDASPLNRSERPDWRTLLRWGALAGLPSAHLGAVTHVLTIEIGSFPMVWVLPLVCYLGSFAVVFRVGGGAPRLFLRFWPEIIAVALFLYLPHQLTLHVVLSHLAIFSVLCLLSHGLLYETRPPASQLTWFYLTMAVAGWLGGAFVSLVAPSVFTGIWEYPIVVLGLAASLALWGSADLRSFIGTASILFRSVRGGGLVLLIGLASLVAVGQLFSVDARYRTFYGTYTVSERSPGLRVISSGGTLHGAQFADRPREPTLYYSRTGDIYDALDRVPSPRRVAMVGLGAGITASYGRPGDSFVFVEIDGELEPIAREWFTFLEQSEADVEVVVGDARRVMKEFEGAPFDVVLVDAFTGDGVPVHLLTAEAIALFMERLAPDGLLVLHISSRYYDLVPSVRATTLSLGLAGVRSRREGLRAADPSVCVLARTSADLELLPPDRWVPLAAGDGVLEVAPWTDDYVNLLIPWLGRAGS